MSKKKNQIVETFVSIQGEGSLQGKNMLFIRWYGCNLECPWCDEPKHVDSKLIKKYTDEELVRMAEQAGVDWVCLTGGEISISDKTELISKFHKAQIKVQAESNGYNPVAIANADVKTCSPKDKFGNIPSQVAGYWTDIKLVVGVGMEVDQHLWAYREACDNLYVQPLNYKDRVNLDNMQYCLDLIGEHPWVGLSPQYHKMLGVE